MTTLIQGGPSPTPTPMPMLHERKKTMTPDTVEGSDSDDTAVDSEQQGAGVCHLLELNKHVETSPKDEVKLREPFDYYRSTFPGKGLRRVILKTLNHHLKLPDAWVLAIAEILEDLHCASLIVDDIEDEATFRRGHLSAHLKYGLAPALSSSNYMYFVANQEIMRLTAEHGGDAHKAIQICLEEMIQLHKGQGIEIYWRSYRQKPTMAEYLRMVSQKTGGLLRLGVRLLGLHPDAAGKQDVVSALVEFGERLGVYYQIRDDYISLTCEEYAALNGFAEDLHEGKYSFPIIHSLDTDPQSGLAELLGMRPDDVRVKKAAISVIRRTGSLDYTVDALQELLGGIEAQLDELGGNEHLEQLLRSWRVGGRRGGV